MEHIHQHHALDYIEFPCTHPERIEPFYAAVFGWSFQSYGPDYLAFHDARLDGGFQRGEVVTTGGPLIILWSDDLEATLAAIKAAGGTIQKPIFSFPGGRRFHFLDPDGNQLGVWSSPA